MHSTFNVLILQSLIFKSMLILLVLKNINKIRKIKIKKKKEGEEYIESLNTERKEEAEKNLQAWGRENFGGTVKEKP